MTHNGDHEAPGGARAAARLSAVQALYQFEQGEDTDPRHIVEQFARHRFGKEIDGSEFVAPDTALFEDIVLGTTSRLAEIDGLITAVLKSGWPLGRLGSVLRALLRAGVYELMARPDIPTAVIIDEYLDVCRAFFDHAEIKFANGILDRLARDLR